MRRFVSNARRETLANSLQIITTLDICVWPLDYVQETNSYLDWSPVCW